ASTVPSPIGTPPGRVPSPGVTGRLAAVSARRPRRVLAVWGLLVMASLGLAAPPPHGLTTTSQVVGATPSGQAEALYDRATGGDAGRQPTDVIVVGSRTATANSDAFRSAVAGLAARLRPDPDISDVRADLGPGSPLVPAGGHAALIELRAATDPDIKPVVAAVQAANGAGGFAVAVTGDHTVGNDFTTLSSSDLRHGEVDFGLPISIVVLLLVFGAVVAGLMPFLMALLSITVGLGIATIVAQEFSLSVFIVNMMTGMGLALGIDYSLFVISRFREERARGLDKDAAIAMTGATASRAVLFSGTTFVIALLGLFLVPTNVLRSLAAGAVIVGVVSVAAALTLLPAVLSLIGDRINALRIPLVGASLGRAGAAEGRMWRSVITRVVRRPFASLVIAGGLLILAAVPVLGLHIGQSGVVTLPDTLPSKQGYLAVAKYFPGKTPIRSRSSPGAPVLPTARTWPGCRRPWPPIPASGPARSRRRPTAACWR
ncbi:MAG: MMPL family transporter, partial [Streptosporangiaceae bacterium]